MSSSANPHISTSANLFLIGFMGCGKSYWGKKWAAALGLDFADMDHEIERNEMLSAEEIFAKKGEIYFRDLETEYLKTLTNKKNFIVACGGGTPCFNDNISLLNKSGKTIYLRSAPEKIYHRLVHERHSRPLIKNLHETELRFYIEEKIKEREKFYLQAHEIIEVDFLQAEYVPEF